MSTLLNFSFDHRNQRPLKVRHAQPEGSSILSLENLLKKLTARKRKVITPPGQQSIVSESKAHQFEPHQYNLIDTINPNTNAASLKQRRTVPQKLAGQNEQVHSNSGNLLGTRPSQIYLDIPMLVPDGKGNQDIRSVNRAQRLLNSSHKNLTSPTGPPLTRSNAVRYTQTRRPFQAGNGRCLG
jgi:hypothetical protein